MIKSTDKESIFPQRYDNHREQILRGHNDYEDESLDIFPYFTAACYKGFGDDDDGFYAIYAQVFDQLATEDIEFMDSPAEYETIPKFGKSTSDYETMVGPFYAYWQSFCTKKTYTWLCPHNINEIRDRRILRELEKETKKLAQKKRKERNDEIRALVSFVRKRDKRVQEYRKVLEAKAEQNRIKQQQHRLAQIRKNQQAAQDAQQNQSSRFDADHEEQLKQIEQAYGTDSESEMDDYEDGTGSELENDADLIEEYYDDLYCVACNKTFKNVLSYENHESSKKHRENTERLKKQMQQDDEEYVNGVEETNNEINSESESDIIEPIETIESKKKSNKKSKKSKKLLQTQLKSDSEHELDDVNTELADVNIGNITDQNAEKDNWSDDGAKKKKKQKSKKNLNKKSTQSDNNVIEDDTQNDNKKSTNKKSNKSTPAETNQNVVDTNHTCVTCSSEFDSKNKLFAHLKKTKHGVYIPKTEEKTNKKK